MSIYTRTRTRPAGESITGSIVPELVDNSDGVAELLFTLYDTKGHPMGPQLLAIWRSSTLDGPTDPDAAVTSFELDGEAITVIPAAVATVPAIIALASPEGTVTVIVECDDDGLDNYIMASCDGIISSYGPLNVVQPVPP
jgi:hypothetical protein